MLVLDSILMVVLCTCTVLEVNWDIKPPCREMLTGLYCIESPKISSVYGPKFFSPTGMSVVHDIFCPTVGEILIFQGDCPLCLRLEYPGGREGTNM